MLHTHSVRSSPAGCADLTAVHPGFPCVGAGGCPCPQSTLAACSPPHLVLTAPGWGTPGRLSAPSPGSPDSPGSPETVGFGQRRPCPAFPVVSRAAGGPSVYPSGLAFRELRVWQASQCTRVSAQLPLSSSSPGSSRSRSRRAGGPGQRRAGERALAAAAPRPCPHQASQPSLVSSGRSCEMASCPPPRPC